MRRIRLTESQFNKLVSKCVKRALNEGFDDEFEGDNGYYPHCPPMPQYSDAERKKMQMDADWDYIDSRKSGYGKPTYTDIKGQMDYDYMYNGNRNVEEHNGKYAIDSLKYPDGYKGRGFGGLFFGNGIYKRSSLSDTEKAKKNK